MKSLLIANRGEIARRIIRTAKRMGVRTVAVWSDADRDALHVREADAALRIGAASPRESYLNSAAIVAAARQAGADAVHPGYGFLAENADFAQGVIDAGLTWVGPPPAVIRQMGDKAEAKRIARAAGVPTVPGYDEADQTETAGQVEPADRDAESGHSGLWVGADGLRVRSITMITMSTPAARASAPARRPTVSGLSPSARSGPP